MDQARGRLDGQLLRPGEATVRRCAAALEPYTSGSYVNFLGEESAQNVRRAYSSRNLARLTAVKDAYDPGNVFHLNHNIQPTNRKRSC